MSQRIVYLAYPIDQADASVAALVEAARKELRRAGVSYYDPGAGFWISDGLPEGPEIWKVNWAAITHASGMLAVLPRGVPSIGVPREIQIGVAAGMPVAVLTDAPTWSLQSGPAVYTLDSYGAHDAVAWLSVTDYRKETRRRALIWTGVCHCDTGPNYDGAAEDCPAHGRDEYRDAVEPRRAYPDDAGFDLTVARPIWIEPGEAVDVPSGIAVELPSYQWGLIIGRSSTRRKRGLMVHPGVIDPGWRGELFVNVENQTKQGVAVEAGERLGQFIVLANGSEALIPTRVDELAPHARGLNGFGSSGS